MWNYLRNRSVHKVLLLLLVDLLLLGAALYCAYTLKFSLRTMRFSLEFAFHRANLFFFLALFSHVAFLYVYGLYSLVRPYTQLRLFAYVFFALLTSTAALMLLQFFVPGYWMGRVVLAVQLPLSTAAICFWRSIFYASPLSSIHTKRLALMGSGAMVLGFLKDAGPFLSFRYTIHGICMTDASAANPVGAPEGLALYRTPTELLADPALEAIAFQSPDPALTVADSQALLHRSCEGVEVSDLITLYKGLTGKVPLRYMDERWLLAYAGIQGGPSPFYLKVKRLLDLLIASLGLLLCLPLMLVVALMVRLDTPGPVLFRQERLGQFRRSFHCLKFRTMLENAEEETGPVWSPRGDPRVTRVGRRLRQLRLDELPQLINVICGDMSLIGPRPIRAHFADRLARLIPLYDLRFALRPGLTGWAQVNHPYADTEESQLEKFEYELFYIQNVSFFLDCVILVKTIRTMLQQRGR